MKNHIQKLMKKVRNFSVFDFEMMKTALLSVGILVGAYFLPYVMSNTIWLALILVVFMISNFYLSYIIAARLQKYAVHDKDTADIPDDSAKTHKASLIHKIVEIVRNFSILDFTMLKTELLSVGILIGFCISPFIMNIIWLVWIIFVASYGYMFYVCFFRREK